MTIPSRFHLCLFLSRKRGCGNTIEYEEKKCVELNTSLTFHRLKLAVISAQVQETGTADAATSEQ